MTVRQLWTVLQVQCMQLKISKDGFRELLLSGRLHNEGEYESEQLGVTLNNVQYGRGDSTRRYDDIHLVGPPFLLGRWGEVILEGYYLPQQRRGRTSPYGLQHDPRL